MGGRDKLAIPLHGTTLLDRVLAAASAVSGTLVVVGPERPTAVASPVFVREEPAGGGPVPAVGAGLEAVGDPSVVLVLAADLPLLDAGSLGRLLDRLGSAPEIGAVAAADPAGRPNPLLAAYRREALVGTVSRLRPGVGVAASRLLPPAVAVLDLGPEPTFNVNSPQDLEEAVRLAAGRREPSG